MAASHSIVVVLFLQSPRHKSNRKIRQDTTKETRRNDQYIYFDRKDYAILQGW